MVTLLGQGLVFGLTVGVMLLGLAGVLLPALPGLPLIWSAALVYGLLDGFTSLNGWAFALLTLLGLAGVGAQLGASQFGARAGGASPWGGLAAIAGGLVGLLILNLPGALLGALLAVFLVEYARQRQPRQALRSSAGWLAGWLAGTGMQLLIGLLMVATFVVSVLLNNPPQK